MHRARLGPPALSHPTTDPSFRATDSPRVTLGDSQGASSAMRTRMVYWYRQQWPIGTYSPDCRYLGGARPPPSGFAVVAPVGGWQRSSRLVRESLDSQRDDQCNGEGHRGSACRSARTAAATTPRRRPPRPVAPTVLAGEGVCPRTLPAAGHDHLRWVVSDAIGSGSAPFADHF